MGEVLDEYFILVFSAEKGMDDGKTREGGMKFQGTSILKRRRCCVS